MNQCPHCDKYIRSETKYCPECGKKLPIWNRALDVYGSSIPRLFAFVHDRVRPNWLGNVLGIAAILIHVTLAIVAIVVLISVITLPFDGQRVDPLEYIITIISIIAFLIFWLRIIDRIICAVEERRAKRNGKKTDE